MDVIVVDVSDRRDDVETLAPLETAALLIAATKALGYQIDVDVQPDEFAVTATAPDGTYRVTSHEPLEARTFHFAVAALADLIAQAQD